MIKRYLAALFLVISISVSASARTVKKCDVVAAPDNVIGTPSYVSTTRCPERNVEVVEPQSPDKPQYKPGGSDGTPHFGEKESEAKDENGAHYDRGNEVYVQPDPDYKKTEEPIVEPQEDALPTQAE